jgi:hypothetical protein
MPGHQCLLNQRSILARREHGLYADRQSLGDRPLKFGLDLSCRLKIVFNRHRAARCKA